MKDERVQAGRSLVQGLDHVSLLVADTAQASAFYQAVLGLQPQARPDLGFPGAWLQIMPGLDLHLLELPNPDPRTGRPDHGGRDRHIALQVGETAPIVAALDARGVRYTRSRSGRDAVFFRDPDGNAIEVVAR